MKAFTVVVNCDETPLTPCGRSMQYTLPYKGQLCEVVNDKLAADLKRFCTVLYSVAARTDGETCERKG